MLNHHALSIILIIIIVLTPPLLSAEDAGSLLRDSQLPDIKPETQIKSSGSQSVSKPKKRIGPFFKVDDIIISGVTVFPLDALNTLKQKVIGNSISIVDIDQLASDIDRFYLNQGFLSKTIIPEQDIISGTVLLKVVESKLGNIAIETQEENLRFDKNQAKAIVGSGQPDSGHLNINVLKDSMQVLNNMPGIMANANLKPSLQVEGTDVVVGVQNTDLFSSVLQIDNYGSESTGKERLLATLMLDGPFGRGDRLGGVISKTEGSEVIQLSASLPVADKGSRISFFASDLQYAVVNQGATTQAEGDSRSYSLQLDVPKWLAPSLYSNETISLNTVHLTNSAGGIESSNKRVNVLSLISRGVFDDIKFSDDDKKPLTVSYNLALSYGDVDLSKNNADLQQDSTTAQVDGSFSKVTLGLETYLPLMGNSGLLLSFKGQKGINNLDSSQKMSLGGASGVRAYPTGEGAGSSAMLLKAEMHYPVLKKVGLFGFIDAGWTRLNEETWAGWQGKNTDQKNEYAIYGAGVGLNWKVLTNFSFQGVVAHKLSSNPGRDVDGNDNDGHQDDYRGWLQLSMQL